MKSPRIVYALKRDRDGTLYRKEIGPGAPWVPFDEIPGPSEVVKILSGPESIHEEMEAIR
jgi:hypothetical protein